MNKNKFLDDPSVSTFIGYVVGKMDGVFHHRSAIIQKGIGEIKDVWQCNNIYDAHLKYKWEYSYIDLFSGGLKRSGSTFSESANALSDMRCKLLDAVNGENDDNAYKASHMILDWGGVLERGKMGFTNKDKLSEIKDSVGLVSYFKKLRAALDPNTVEIRNEYWVGVGRNNDKYNIIMNSGFTKIYSLLIDDFVIYDSRVGAALGLLARECLCGQHNNVGLLSFAYGSAQKSKKCIKKTDRRDPGNAMCKFPKLHGVGNARNATLHINNNIMASWVMKEILTRLPKDSGFMKIDEPLRLRAFESALFMIGSCIDCECAKKLYNIET